MSDEPPGGFNGCPYNQSGLCGGGTCDKREVYLCKIYNMYARSGGEFVEATNEGSWRDLSDKTIHRILVPRDSIPNL